MDMIRNVNENMVLSDKLLQWARTLFLNTNPAALPGLMADELADQFAVPQVGIKVWGVDAAYAGAPFAQGVSEDAKVFASSLTEPSAVSHRSGGHSIRLPDPKAVAVPGQFCRLRAGLVGQHGAGVWPAGAGLA